MVDPEDDGCSDAYGGHERMCAAVVARVDASPVFEFSEHVFDLVPLAIECCVVRDRELTVCL